MLPDGSSQRVGITRAHLEEDAGAVVAASSFHLPHSDACSGAVPCRKLAAPACKRPPIDVVSRPADSETRSIQQRSLNPDPGPAGKLMHEGAEQHSLVDYNRAGVPLLEIVSEPDMASGAAAAAYGAEIRRIVRFLGISDGNMQVRRHVTQPGSLLPRCLVCWRRQGRSWAGHAAACRLLGSQEAACVQTDACRPARHTLIPNWQSQCRRQCNCELRQCCASGGRGAGSMHYFKRVP